MGHGRIFHWKWLPWLPWHFDQNVQLGYQDIMAYKGWTWDFSQHSSKNISMFVSLCFDMLICHDLSICFLTTNGFPEERTDWIGTSGVHHILRHLFARKLRFFVVLQWYMDMNFFPVLPIIACKMMYIDGSKSEVLSRCTCKGLRMVGMWVIDVLSWICE